MEYFTFNLWRRWRGEGLVVGALIGAFFLFTGLVMLGGVPIRNRCVLRGIVVGPLGIVMSGVDCLGNGLLEKENMARRALYSCCCCAFNGTFMGGIS